VALEGDSTLRRSVDRDFGLSPFHNDGMRTLRRVFLTGDSFSSSALAHQRGEDDKKSCLHEE
jgi:hypothetical protein